jgi:catechol 2,3-dioxygenase-like lactoylglutathione lyase family enzyme
MKPAPFIYTTDMSRSIEWYRAVIPEAELISESPFWSELDIDGDVLALHGTESISPGGAAGVAFVADEPLEHVLTRLRDAGIEAARGIADEPFGRSIVLEDPDGFRFQVNEYTAT